MESDNTYSTGNLLVYKNFSKRYELIATNLRKQIELMSSDVTQEINFSSIQLRGIMTFATWDIS